jgi:hypothetical protein
VVTLVRAVPASTLAGWKEAIIGFVPHVNVPVPGIADVTAVVPANVLLFVGAALLLAPIAIYFAVAED